MRMMKMFSISVVAFALGLWTSALFDGESPFIGPRTPTGCAAMLRADDTKRMGAYCQGSAIALAQEWLKEHPELFTQQ